MCCPVYQTYGDILRAQCCPVGKEIMCSLHSGYTVYTLGCWLLSVCHDCHAVPAGPEILGLPTCLFSFCKLPRIID